MHRNSPRGYKLAAIHNKAKAVRANFRSRCDSGSFNISQVPATAGKNFPNRPRAVADRPAEAAAFPATLPFSAVAPLEDEPAATVRCGNADATASVKEGPGAVRPSVPSTKAMTW